MIIRTDPVIFCIECAERRKTNSLFIIPFRLCSKDGCHLKKILIILKNVLTVDASEHHVVDTCSALLPYLSGHIISCNTA